MKTVMLQQGSVPLQNSIPVPFHQDYYQIYYEALDLIVQSVDARFEQPGYKVYKGLEDLALKAANKVEFSEELAIVTDMYDNDLD